MDLNNFKQSKAKVKVYKVNNFDAFVLKKQI